jgi:hypothetical protein
MKKRLTMVLAIPAFILFFAVPVYAAPAFSGSLFGPFGLLTGDIGTELGADAGGHYNDFAFNLNFDVSAAGMTRPYTWLDRGLFGGIADINLESGRGIPSSNGQTQVTADFTGFAFSPAVSIAVILDRAEYEQNMIYVTMGGWSPMLMLDLGASDHQQYLIVSPLVGTASGSLAGNDFTSGGKTNTITESACAGLKVFAAISDFYVDAFIGTAFGSTLDPLAGKHSLTLVTGRLALDYRLRFFGLTESVGLAFKSDTVSIDGALRTLYRAGVTLKFRL